MLTISQQSCFKKASLGSTMEEEKVFDLQLGSEER
jgi:hypothetical protein